MKLERAKIKVITPLSGPAAALVEAFPSGIEVRFNPSEYTLVRNVSYAEVQVLGLETSILQFVRGETQTLALELYLDRSDRVAYDGPVMSGGGATEGQSSAGGGTAPTTGFQGIQPELDILRLLVTIDSGLHAPPVVEFNWGKLSFRGVVSSYQERFQLFDESGQALRARVTLTLKKYKPPELQARALARESPDRTKVRVVREGERLDTIAAEEYGDPIHWREIARANRLARPRVLTPGTALVIPPL